MEKYINKIINDDCLNILKKMPNECIDLVVTDPPYLVTSRGGSGTMGGYWTSELAHKGLIFKENQISCKDYLPELYRVLKEGTHCYIMINHINLIEMLNVATECGFKFIKSLIWDKGNKICGRFYMNCFEYILMFRKGSSRDINNCSTPDILSVPIKKVKDINGDNLHNTEKPIKLMEILIENSSNENDLILDPFMGSGTTAIACRNLNRKFICIEKDEEYYKKSIERFKNTYAKRGIL